MKKLDLTALGVEKLDKKQMAEINGGQSLEDYRRAAEFWAPRGWLKGISLIDAFTEGFNSAK